MIKSIYNRINRKTYGSTHVVAKMGDGNPFERHIVSMMALGRRFKIGDLYDYCSDRILAGMFHYYIAIGYCDL